MNPRFLLPREMIRAAGLAAALLGAADLSAVETKDAREYYNDGVRQFARKELREAESSLRLAVLSNQAAVQPVAVYNLGHVRFAQGQETLKGGVPDRQQLIDSLKSTSSLAEEVIRRITPLVTSEVVNTLVGAYMEARTARKRIRLSRDELRREQDLVGSAIRVWERARGDFRSAQELDSANPDAAFNADVVDRRIKELEKYRDSLEEAQEILTQQRAELTKMMKEMRGKIPKERQRESDDEEDDEDEEPEEPKQSKADKGQQQQRVGGDREIDPDVRRMLIDKIKSPTMQFGQDSDSRTPSARPGDRDGDREGGLRPGKFDENPREPKRRGRDW